MTARIRHVVLAVVMTLAAVADSSARQRWIELYDEAVRHVERGEWNEAETKLQQAIKLGPTNRRRAIRRQGMLFDDYLPEFYLGRVYLATSRPKPALAMFDAARKAGVDMGRGDFRQIGAYEQKAKADLTVVATNIPSGGGKPTPPPDPTEKPAPPVNPPTTAPPVTAAPAEPKVAEVPPPRKLDIATLVARVEDALKRRDAASARQELNTIMAVAPTAPAATGLSVRVFQLERELHIERIEDAVKRRDLTLARRELGAFAKDSPGAPAVKELTARVSQLERELSIEGALGRRDAQLARRELNALAKTAPSAPGLAVLTKRVLQLERELSDGLYRDAMMAYFSGNYQQALDSLGLAEKLIQLTARGHFYRACSLAAQAATASQDKNSDQRIREARQSYQRANSSPTEFKRDLQYISPRILRLVGAS